MNICLKQEQRSVFPISQMDLAYYQERVHHYTTTDFSYEEVYQIGLKEVERIKKQMLDVLKEVNFTGTMQEFIA